MLLLGVAALRLGVAEKATVQQLQSALAAARAANEPDKQIAQKIEAMTLTERLTDATLAALLQSKTGPDTQQELQIQADRSAFLEPPTSELPNAPRPAMSDQRLMIAHAVNYTAGFIQALPNFICTEIIRRLDDDPTRPVKKSEKWKNIQLRDTLTEQLTFNHGEESSTFQMVNGRPYHGKQEIMGMVTRGEFGEMLSSMLLGRSGLKAWWSHWEIIGGKRLAVFHYAVDKAHSQYAVSYCCHEIKTPNGIKVPNTIFTAFRGELFLEPTTGKIFRVTWQTVNLPAGFPTRQTSTAVDYGPVSISGRTYMCPLRSLSTSDSEMFSAVGPFIYPIYSINEIRFTQYRKFETEATFMAGGDSHTHDETGGKTHGPLSIQVMTPDVTVQPETPLVPANFASAPALAAGTGTLPEGFASAGPLTMFPLPLPPPFEPMNSSTDDASADTSAARPTFEEHLNVVTVPVVVRDSGGRVVGDLTKDDFELFDGRKRQRISGFTVERAKVERNGSADQPRSFEDRPGEEKTELPDRYVAFLIDDLHLSTGDLQWARKAAKQVLDEPGDKEARAAVFSTSGRVTTGFTADSAELQRAWNRVMPAPHMAGCPQVSYYMADRIINGNDRSALAVAAAEAIACGAAMPDPHKPEVPGNAAGQATGDSQAERVAKAAAMLSLNEHTTQSRRVLLMLQTIARKMAVLPGRRTIVLISPGFFTSALALDIDGVIDRAARAGVVVNAVDARGLYVPAGYDVETRGLSNPEMNTRKREFDSKEQQLQSDVLAELADGTGGTLFENSNDLQGGLKRAAARPDVSYVLEFSPQEQKADGRFHRLTVRVTGRKGLVVEARRGYVVPKTLKDPAAQAKQELMEAVFSREKRNEVPVTLRLMVTKSGATPSRLAVAAHVDVRHITFEKRDGRNRDALTAVMSLFNANGEYLRGLQDKLNLDFPDGTLAARMRSGVDFENDFDVSPGTYLVRLVLRDAEGQMGTANGDIAVQ